jgi:MFS superfamily sulfate permease-like transporter
MDALNKVEAQPVLIPCIGWLHRYQKDWLRPDVMAGLTAAAENLSLV